MSRSGDDDQEPSAFRRAFADVKPLSSRSPKRVTPKADGRSVRYPRPGEPPATLDVEREGDGVVSGRRASTHRSILESLEDPRLDVEAECDLHGLTAREAERETARFVESCQRSGKRWVRIVVGKGLHSRGGRATLRDRVVSTLSGGRAARYVLAFRTAPERLGGTGALTVRLVDRL